MIKKLVVSNFRSLGPDIHFEPGKLSFFIGPNGSGKSNILDVLSFVRDSVMQGLPAAITQRGGIDTVRRRSHGRPFDVHIELQLLIDQQHVTYEFIITGDRLEEYRVKTEKAIMYGSNGEEKVSFVRNGHDWDGPEGVAPFMDEQSLALTPLGGTKQFKPLVDFLSGLTVYSIFPDTLRVPQRFDSSHPLKEHGENWVSILRELVKEKYAKDDIVTGLRKLTGDIEDVRVASAAGYLIAEFKQQVKGQKAKRWFDAAQQSDGTLRVAGLLTALVQSPALPVIGVEEPELTVHPGALPMLYDYLRQASEVSQVFVTTHSPIILDVVDIENDVIFVVNRVEGKTDVQKITGQQLEPVRKSLLRLGDLFMSGDLQLSLFDDTSWRK
ncbi:AAA family ATPase [Candidatus Electrothrix sp.]|uniref:AAA family ATPase n=1 Tax=Candidatus Electrothrix sp. TaxID=2170559 RepID=UPI004055E415